MWWCNLFASFMPLVQSCYMHSSFVPKFEIICYVSTSSLLCPVSLLLLHMCGPLFPLYDLLVCFHSSFVMWTKFPQHNHDVISGSHACRDCVWPIMLDAELYTTCPRERVSVFIRFNVTFLPLRLCYVNTSTCFSKDAESLTTYGHVLWCSQIACTRHYSLNATIAFYSVNEWSNFAVSVWSMAWQATMLSHFT